MEQNENAIDCGRVEFYKDLGGGIERAVTFNLSANFRLGAAKAEALSQLDAKPGETVRYRFINDLPEGAA